MLFFRAALPLAFTAMMLPVVSLAQSASTTDTSTAPSGAPALGETYQAEQNGDWELRCVKSDTPSDPCQMYQLLTDGEGSAIAEVTLFRLPQGGQAVAGATIVVPLETALPNQLRIQVDGGLVKTYPYAFCNTVGCYARIGLTQDDIVDFKRGATATLSIVPALAPDQVVAISMSLKGFTASFDKTTVLTQ